MKRISQGLALTSLCLSLAACGAARFYTLPVNPAEAEYMQALIGACATDYGHQSYTDTSLVTVKYDDTASLYYRYEGGAIVNMQVIVDDKKVFGEELEQKFAASKARGDDIYACAQMRLNPPPAQVVVVTQQQQPPPPPAPAQDGVSFNMKADSTGMSVSMQSSSSSTVSASSSQTVSASATGTGTTVSASAGPGGYCAQAMDCYGQLAKTVCEGASDCSFKAEFSGNNEESCRKALLDVPQMLQPFSMMRPGLSAPAVCRVQ